VIITVVTVRMMQVAFYQVVNVAAVGHPFVAAIRTMNVPFVVTGALMVSCATLWVRCVHLKHVLVNMIPVHMVQVPLMQVIDVPVMADGFMPAVWPMLVSVVSMLLAFIHDIPPPMSNTHADYG
jgi:magnesium-transporting ATPase (P-type)